MCGFIGKVSINEFDLNSLDKPNELIECRGPDSNKKLKCNLKEFFSEDLDLHCALLFNRLSIIDLNESADQPMVSTDNKSIILFNGEIYNHKELRNELIKHNIKFSTSHSDTEVALLGISTFGIDYVKKFIGQFSIVFIDYKSKKIFLVRDRVGQKPLFYKVSKDSLIFSSNLKSIISSERTYSIDNDALNEYIDLGVVTSPKTIFSDVMKLKPGEIIEFSFNDKGVVSSNRLYWVIEDHLDNQSFNINEFSNILKSSIKYRNISDVPVANYLSGGIDSTSLVKMQSEIKRKPNTFSIGYKDSKFDESKWFNLVAKKYDTKHIFEMIENNFNLDDIDKSIQAFDEPYCDPSTVPSYYLSKEMSKYYKVGISGDGGDELFGGYKRTIDQLKNKNNFLSLFTNLIYKFYPSFLGTGNRILSKSKNYEKSYTSYFSDPKFLKLLNIKNYKNQFSKYIKNSDDLYKMLQIIEYKFYLSEMMMLKVDRTSMFNSLEVRSPFVDHRLIEYIISRSSDYIDLSNPKKILKDVILNDFDDQFLNRKKMGFVFDIKEWVYSNIDYLEEVFKTSDLNNYLNLKNIWKLKIFKSRINATRIWKIYFLDRYLNDIKTLVN